MAERDRTVLLIVGAQDRHQKRLVNWARRANPLIQISEMGSVNEALELLRALERPKKTCVIIYVRSLPASSDDQQSYGNRAHILVAGVSAVEAELVLPRHDYRLSLFPCERFRSPSLQTGGLAKLGARSKSAQAETEDAH